VAQQAVHVTGADILAAPHSGIELLQHLPGRGAGFGRPGEDDDVAVRLRLDAKALLKQGQVPVVFAQQSVQMAVVLERHHHSRLRTLGGFTHVRRRRPAHARQLWNLPKWCALRILG